MHLVTSVALGGAENVAFDLSEGCRTVAGEPVETVVAEVHHSASDYAARKRAELAARGIRTLTLSRLPKRASLLVAPFVLAWHAMRLQPAIVHSHTDLPDFVLSTALRLLRALRRPLPALVRTIHNVSLWETHPAMGAYTERAFVQDTVVAVSDAALRAYLEARQRHGLLPSPHRSTVYNGCREPGRKPPPFALDPSRPNILFCGRLSEQKGIDVLVERIRSLPHPLADALAFHVVGAGPLQPMVEQLAAARPGVHLHAPFPGASDCFHAFDAMVMPSRFEGLPLVAIEASLAGLPVIAARAPGLTETLPDDWPLYFELHDVASLTAVLSALVSDRTRLARAATQARAFARGRFALDTMVDRYRAVYGDALRRPPAAA